MTDPRKEPGWKQRRHDEKLLLLLGAILDAVTPPERYAPPNLADLVKVAPEQPVVKPRNTRKTNA